MTTVRIARRHKYTQVDRRSINDCGLSLRAIGLLVWLLDKPDDWRVDSRAISGHVREGREAVRTAMKELTEAGFMVTRKFRMSGRWATEVFVFEHPSMADQATEGEQMTTLTGAQESDPEESPTRAQEPDAGNLGPVVPEDCDQVLKDSSAEADARAAEPDQSEPDASSSPRKSESARDEDDHSNVNADEESAREVNVGQLVKGFLDWCDRERRPRPANVGMLARNVKAILVAGHEVHEVKMVLPDLPTFTVPAFEMALAKRREARERVHGDHHRDAPPVRDPGGSPLAVDWRDAADG